MSFFVVSYWFVEICWGDWLIDFCIIRHLINFFCISRWEKQILVKKFFLFCNQNNPSLFLIVGNLCVFFKRVILSPGSVVLLDSSQLISRFLFSAVFVKYTFGPGQNIIVIRKNTNKSNCYLFYIWHCLANHNTVAVDSTLGYSGMSGHCSHKGSPGTSDSRRDGDKNAAYIHLQQEAQP